MAIIKKQGEEINEMKTRAAAQPQDMSVRAQVEAWAEQNKEQIEKIKKGERPNESLKPMQLRAPITMTVGASLGGSAYLPNVQVAPGVVDLVRTQPTFWDRLVKGRTKANPYVWVNKKNKQGAATFIGEGIAKPPASFELETESSNPKKVAETMKVSTELLFDVDAMYSMIENELRFEVMTAANTAVLTGVNSSTVPAGVTTLAVPYSLITIKTTNPTEADAIRACIAQLKVFNFDSGIVAFVNPIDGANMDLAKGVTGGAYLLPPFVSADGRRIGNVLVIEDNNIAQGNLLIGDMSKYKISMYQDFFVNWGWENDDFTKNLVTVIGEMRFHQYFSSNHEGAFIYDTFSNIKTAITV
jgi:HK97 family phage major capsid protein